MFKCRKAQRLTIDKYLYLIPSAHSPSKTYTADLDDRVIVEEIQPAFGGLMVKVRHTSGSRKGQTELVNEKFLMEAIV